MRGGEERRGHGASGRHEARDEDRSGSEPAGRDRDAVRGNFGQLDGMFLSCSRVPAYRKLRRGGGGAREGRLESRVPGGGSGGFEFRWHGRAHFDGYHRKVWPRPCTEVPRWLFTARKRGGKPWVLGGAGDGVFRFWELNHFYLFGYDRTYSLKSCCKARRWHAGSGNGHDEVTHCGPISGLLGSFSRCAAMLRCCVECLLRAHIIRWCSKCECARIQGRR